MNLAKIFKTVKKVVKIATVLYPVVKEAVKDNKKVKVDALADTGHSVSTKV